MPEQAGARVLAPSLSPEARFNRLSDAMEGEEESGPPPGEGDRERRRRRAIISATIQFPARVMGKTGGGGNEGATKVSQPRHVGAGDE